MDLAVGVQRSKNVGLMMREKALVMGFSDSKKESFQGTKNDCYFRPVAWHVDYQTLGFNRYEGLVNSLLFKGSTFVGRTLVSRQMQYIIFYAQNYMHFLAFTLWL